MYLSNKLYLPLSLLVLIASGCAHTDPQHTLQIEDATTITDNHTTPDKKVHDEAKGVGTHPTYRYSSPKSVYERVPQFGKPNSNALSLKAKQPPTIELSDDKVKVSVDAIPLNEFVDLIFGQVLKLNYTVDESVKAMKTPLSLNMQQSLESTKLYAIVKKMLAMKGVKVQNQQGVLFLYKSKSKTKTFQDVYIGYGRELPSNIDDDREVVLLVPYNYLNPKQAVNLVVQSGINTLHFYYYFKNIQAIKGKAGEVRKALQIISLIDRPFIKGKIPYLINFDNIDVSSFEEEMKKIYTLNGIKVTSSPSAGGIVMTPMKELNALYVITPKREWLDMLLYWKRKFDVIQESGGEPRLYVYHVHNRKADELAKAIQGAIGLTKGTPKRSLLKPNPIKNPEEQIPINDKKELAEDGLHISTIDYTPTITADLDTNMLMMKLKPEHYKLLLPFIKQLDQLPLQALVQLTIAEVTMTNTFSLGFEHAIRNKGLGISDILNVAGSGSGLGIIFRGNKIDTTINAFAEKKRLNILSKPRMLVLNNSTGSINIGTQVPIVVSETSASDINNGGNTPSINRNITYRTTGVNVGVTPTINSNGILKMSISVSLSEAQLNDTSGIDSPLIVNRQLNTVAVVKSGDAILLGGLISQNRSKSNSGVPLLRDIPWIGRLFATQSYKKTKTELIILIRPVILESPQAAHYETKRFKTILEYINTVEL